MEWLLDNGWILWLVLFLGLAAVETLTLDLFFLMLSVGALAALVATFVGAGLVLQIVVFAVVALLMILLVRPVAVRHLRKGPADQLNNIERLVGAAALALEPVTAHSGTVKIGGDTWTARSADGAALPAGTRLSVARIDGATAVVQPAAAPDSRPAPAGDA
ncbi:NfeD family protein [Arthrobacter agilis]|jgi:membrane protein implicated in regulation of membrane protease activity|uniref:NfeD family protein n=1 Tax=Arthrobacter agilis TaxID=37921 RepID=UPI002789FCC1|nr:NfeD family protein [Arthrobacter agilis]MDQ0734847.1 membrane protein implicated in regulation of membrane protease activity [Arthrobacter agilis]